MYDAVPSTVPASVSVPESVMRAIPKSAIFGLALAVEEDVRRLQVAMDEPALVRVREPCGDLGRDPQCLRVGQRRARFQAILERAVRQVLEHHVRLSVGLAVVVERAEVRMRERGGRARFALEAGAVGGRREELHRDAAGRAPGPRRARPSSSPHDRVARSAGTALRSARRSSPADYRGRSWKLCRGSTRRSGSCSHGRGRSPPRTSRSRRPRAGCSPRPRVPPSTCRRSTARRWTASQSARRTRRGA